MLPTALQVIQDPEILLMAAQHGIVTARVDLRFFEGGEGDNHGSQLQLQTATAEYGSTIMDSGACLWGNFLKM